ncbi:MAG: TldD/PmbA family protein [Candidatus Odinarchaeota archaeon]|nr:TldD/PmbA family protein [Candidatus Odinarchaeota archaeon]
MSEQIDILDLGKKILNLVERCNPNEAEVYLNYKRYTNVTIKSGEFSEASSTSDLGFGVRVIIEKKLGFAYSNKIDDETIEAVIKNAISAAKASKDDEKWKSLPLPKEDSKVEDLYDPNIANLSSEKVVEMAGEAYNSMKNVDPRVIPIWGGASSIVSHNAILNTHGIEKFDKHTVVFVGLATIAKDGDKVTPYTSEFEIDRKLNVNPKRVGEEVAKRSIELLKGVKAETGEYDVILAQDALISLWNFTFLESVKADFVQSGRSRFADKIGEVIASDKLSVLDDGTYPAGIRSSHFDDEGVPSQKKYIIEKGILKTFLYDNYTAKIEDRESTGNGIRSQAAVGTMETYMLLPKPEVTNIVIEPGKISKDDLIAEIKNGFLVWDVQGAHSSNPESGEVSVVATPCFKIENGEITGAVYGMMLSGNMYEMMKKVKGIANNVRKSETVIAPWVSFSNIKMISK